MKVYVSDDTVLSFGGVNFTGGSFVNHDYLIETTSKPIADIVFEHAERLYQDGRIATTSLEHGIVHVVDKENEVLIDYGRPNKSIIYETAIELTRSADAGVLFVSQHRPGGKLEFALAEKLDELGPDRVEIMFNHHTAFKGTGRLQQFIESWTPFVSEVHPESGYIHAKCIIVYFKDGSRVALTGSHNFHQGGVQLGTSEIALKTRDTHLIDQLERFARTIPT